MKKIFCGKGADGRPLYLTPELRQSSHMHVIGGTRTGKSKFLEWLIRQDIDAGNGFCLIDWHGSLYHDVLKYCEYRRAGVAHYGVKDFRQLVLVDPSQPDFISGFNPFMNPGEDISTQVNRRIDATVRPWGGSDTDEMPTFERMARILFTFMAETGQTLPNAAALLDPQRRQLRDYAIRIMEDAHVRGQLQRLQTIKTTREWEDKVLSMENRLSRFIGSLAVRRFMGLTDHNIDLLDIMDSGKILLVNLGASGYLDRKAATVFASLLLYEFMDTAMRRAVRARGSGNKPGLYPIYLDEFQNYITDDIAEALDQALKGGLHLVLAHQHLAQLAKKDGTAWLKDSIFTNARIRAVFGGLPHASAEELANEMFLPDLNTRQIKKAYYHTIHVYPVQTRLIRSRGKTRGTMETHGTTSGSGSASGSQHGAAHGRGHTSGRTMPGLGAPPEVEGWFTEGDSTSDVYSDSYSDAYSEFSGVSDSTGESESESESETLVPVWVPTPKQELTTEAEWTLEEKRSKMAQIIKQQEQRRCFIKLDTEKTQPMLVEFVKDVPTSEPFVQKYQHELFKTQGALPAAEVDRLVEEGQRKFLEAARVTIDITPEPERELVETQSGSSDDPPEPPHHNPFDEL